MCNAILEAMACGVPVIATDIPNNQVFGDCIQRIEFENTDACVSAIDTLAHDIAGRLRLAQSARDEVEKKYDLVLATKRYADILFRKAG